MQAFRKIKVLVVDDSALMRQLLTAILQEDSAFEVVGTAADPFIAREKIKALKPHVLTLDIEMPGMDGITFLEKLMRLHPMPVVMISSLTGQGAVSTLRALQLGAIDVVAKPAGANRSNFLELADEIRAKVRAASMARVRMDQSFGSPIMSADSHAHTDARKLIVIGASAGGTQAIMEILRRLPAELPAIAIVQHMPPKFTTLFADHLNRNSVLDVHEGKHGDVLKPGTVWIAPGGRQMAVMQTPTGFELKIDDSAQVNLHRPSVDVLFHSAAKHAGPHTLGILLTGMGNDGAQGLKALRDSGAFTIAQDQASSVIFGMPEQAIRLGAASVVVGLDHMPDRIVEWARHKN